jgi:hypothetical protein
MTDGSAKGPTILQLPIGLDATGMRQEIDYQSREVIHV